MSELPDGPLPAAATGRFARAALFADVHGNAWALRAAVADAQRSGVDAHFHLGCLTWGPRPREVLEIAAGSPVPTFFLRGNGDRAAWEMAGGRRPAARAVDAWMVEAHGPEVIEAIAGWPVALVTEIDDLGQVRLCHGSPRSDLELLTPDTPAGRVAAACQGVAETTVVHGHTHLQYQRTIAEKRLAGCGSVGLPYTTEPGYAYWSLVDAFGIHGRRTPYDVNQAVTEVRASDYPDAERFAKTLFRPPTPAEIIADAHVREFAD